MMSVVCEKNSNDVKAWKARAVGTLGNTGTKENNIPTMFIQY